MTYLKKKDGPNGPKKKGDTVGDVVLEFTILVIGAAARVTATTRTAVITSGAIAQRLFVTVLWSVVDGHHHSPMADVRIVIESMQSNRKKRGRKNGYARNHNEKPPQN